VRAPGLQKNMATTVLAIAAVASVALASYQYATAPGMPKPPDLAGASRAGVEAETATLGDRRGLEAAAQQGGKYTYKTDAHKDKVPAVEVFQTKGSKAGQSKGWVAYHAEDWQPGGQYYGLNHGSIEKHHVLVPGETKTADFTGYGEADVQGAIARQNAASQLALQKKYDPQFIEEALKERELADPQGVAARKRMGELIDEQVNAKPERPVAELLDRQVGDQLHDSNRLGRVQQEMLDAAVAKAQASRGGAANGTADYSDPLTTGFEGEARREAANQKALGWLTSGATPEDVEYRREQQNLANESAFINGQTPESQFATLSGAQQGAAPFTQGTPLARENQNAGAAMQSAQIQGWGTQLQQQAQTANPWLAGASLALKGATAYGAYQNGGGSTVPRTT
jgi:hypothetical protein